MDILRGIPLYSSTSTASTKSLPDKGAFAEMLQRDDITVVAEGLLEGIKQGLSLEYMVQQ
jgi:hypothetical protein